MFINRIHPSHKCGVIRRQSSDKAIANTVSFAALYDVISDDHLCSYSKALAVALKNASPVFPAAAAAAGQEVVKPAIKTKDFRNRVEKVS